MKKNSKVNFHNQPEGQFSMKTVKRLLSYMKKYRRVLIIVFLCIVISAIASVVSSMFLQILVDDYITPMLGTVNPNFSGLIKTIFLIAFVYIIGILATWVYNRFMVTVAQGTLKQIRDDMFEKMQRLPVPYFDGHTYGEIMSLYTNDTDTLRQLIAQSMSQLVTSLCTIIAVFCCMVYISLWLTLIVVIAIVLILQVVKKVAGDSSIHFVHQQEALGDLDGYVEEMIGGQKVVKVFCHESKCKEIFKQKNEFWRESASSANGIANSMMPMLNALGYILFVVVAVVGAYMAISHTMNLSITGSKLLTFGMIASFLSLTRSFAHPIAQISNQFNSVITALAGVARIFAFLDEKEEQDNGYVTLVNASEKNGEIIEVREHTGVWAWKHPHSNGTTTFTKLQGEVILDHVDFSYVAGKQILKDISLYAKPGQKIAFVGSTGAGKTTITNLLTRFYEIWDGGITLDGRDIRTLNMEELRKNIALVLQDTHLFTGTVMENIRYGRLDASDEEVIAAAKTANADYFIRHLSEGYDTVLEGDGSNLSQGQRQLLNIARAALSKAPVLIMDEATSSVDTITERQIQDGMDRLMSDRTTFVIAHRLSTIRNADAIMVLENGEIIEWGTHEQLLAMKGRYYELYTGKAELD